KKHEIRSGATPGIVATTGIDGTYAVTDKLDGALKFDGMHDVKILFIARGQDAFATQTFAERTGTTQLGKIAYTPLKPNDYIM
ncbi:hypothetical protein ABTN36_18790, partial [Acinetobacter baumannii]